MFLNAYLMFHCVLKILNEEYRNYPTTYTTLCFFHEVQVLGSVLKFCQATTFSVEHCRMSPIIHRLFSYMQPLSPAMVRVQRVKESLVRTMHSSLQLVAQNRNTECYLDLSLSADGFNSYNTLW